LQHLSSPAYQKFNKMIRAREIFLMISILAWAILVGGIAYSHMVFFPAYLHHLPASTSLVSGPFGLQDENFWMLIHPLSLLSLLLSLIVNWKSGSRRKNILYTLTIYLVILAITAFYFVPELKAFAQSEQSAIPATAWLERGIRWERFSWVRGFFMVTGFLSLLAALTKNPGTKQL
jgi:hypothetical protein